MARLITVTVAAAALMLLVCGQAFATTDSPRIPSARLLPDDHLRLAMFDDPAPVGQQAVQAEDAKKSYAAVIPMAFLVGFGSAHFYCGATWRGLRYLAYDLVAIGIDVAIIVLSYNRGYDTLYTWVVAGIVFGGNRIFQTIDAAQTASAYNKGLDVSESRRDLAPPSQRAVSLNDGGMPPAPMKTVYTF